MDEKKIIEFRNIVKSFDGQIILKGVNLDIYEKEFVTLLGPSGCGKTTILHLISGLLHADSGSIIFAGQELLGLDNKSRARWRSQNIGYILQRLNLLEELSRSLGCNSLKVEPLVRSMRPFWGPRLID